MDIEQLIRQMTVEEKISLLAGASFWSTRAVERLNIPSIVMTDGPHGLRLSTASEPGQALSGAEPATAFPIEAAMASTWNEELIYETGKVIAEECQHYDVAVLLGPGLNGKRTPLGGRNFEYFSEDPYLSGKMGAAYIRGVQDGGVGTSAKHFVANEQETNRMVVSSEVDERALREIYLLPFEMVVREAGPWTVMCSYNKVNGTSMSRNDRYLNGVLKQEWGFDGLVVSDWGAVTDKTASVMNGLDLEMPGPGTREAEVLEAYRNKQITDEQLDDHVRRILRVIQRVLENKRSVPNIDADKHHALARAVAEEAIVLLKNESAILPLAKQTNIAVCGKFAEVPRFQGGGSSHMNPARLDIPLEEIGEFANTVYGLGYADDGSEQEDLLQEARELARGKDAVIVFAGTTELIESEGYDRADLNLPAGHIRLIETVAEVNPNVVVVVNSGSAVNLAAFDAKVKAILQAWLPGQAGGSAIANILFGEVNPSGKLAETFPHKLSDNPSHLFFPGEGDRVEYREGLFVGYRYYDAKEIEPLFPFGHGLSYTTFAYEKIEIDRARMSDGETAEVRVTIANTGGRAGKEIVQLYVRDRESSVIRPVKELKGFAKVELQPGERKTVTFRLGKRAFAYYEPAIRDWRVESGEFDILVGASSRDIRLQGSIYVESTVTLPWVIHRNTLIGDLLADERTAPYVRRMLEKNAPFGSAPTEELKVMLEAFLKYMPLRNIASFNRESATDLDALLEELNRLVSST